MLHADAGQSAPQRLPGRVAGISSCSTALSARGPQGGPEHAQDQQHVTCFLDVLLAATRVGSVSSSECAEAGGNVRQVCIPSTLWIISAKFV
jgi:hypothetical protein